MSAEGSTTDETQKKSTTSGEPSAPQTNGESSKANHLRKLSAAAPSFVPKALRADASVFVPGASFKPTTGGPSLASRSPAASGGTHSRPSTSASLGGGGGGQGGAGGATAPPTATTAQQKAPIPPPPAMGAEVASSTAAATKPPPPSTAASGPEKAAQQQQQQQQTKAARSPPRSKPIIAPAPRVEKKEITGASSKAAESSKASSQGKGTAEKPVNGSSSSPTKRPTTTTTTAVETGKLNGEAKLSPTKKAETAPISPATESEKTPTPSPPSEKPTPSPPSADSVPPSTWRRGLSIPENKAVAAPVPVKALPLREGLSEWERSLDLPSPSTTPAIPDPPVAEGIQQYFIRDLLRIRRELIEGGPQGPPIKPEGSVIASEILQTEPVGPNPIPTPSPSPGPLSSESSRSRTPKVGAEGLPRPRSAGLGPNSAYDNSGGRNTPNDVASFGRQGSGFRDDRGPRRGRGKRGAFSPAPDEDGYAPKRIEEERRWKPESLQYKRGGPDQEDPEKKIKRARAILNKLSLEKFDKLSVEFVNVDFTSEDLLRRAIDIIVTKAQEEVHFSSMYAELCLSLSRRPLEGLGEVEKGKKFRKILLTRCQEEFYEDLPTRMAKFDDMDLSQEEKAEKKRMSKFRYLGHMRFIGELFLKELLKEEHVHDCIKELFGEEDSPDEENLACLCKLLSTTGKKLEVLAEVNSGTSKKQRRLLDKYFKEVKELSEGKDKLSSRTRCLLKDLYELRQNNYVPRRAVETAKTLSQVHEEAAREEQAKGGEKMKNRRQNSSSRLNEGAGSGSQDARVSSSAGGGGGKEKLESKPSSTSLSTVDDDGWETVGGKKSTVTKSSSKVSLARSSSNSSLGMSGGGGGSMKKAGSYGAFAVLQDGSSSEKKKKKEKKDKKEKDGSKKSSKEKKEKKEKEREEDEDEEEGEGSDGDAKAPASRPPIDEKDLTRKGKAILSEYTELKDEKEAVDCMKELRFEDSQIVKVVGIWIADVLEKKDEHRALLADLLVILHKEGLAPCVALGEAFAPHLEFLADSKVDIPKIDIWLAKILAQLIEAEAMAVEYLQNLPEQMIEDGVAASFAVTVLSELKKRVGGEKTKQLMDASGIDLRSLVAPDLESSEEELTKLMETLAL